MSCWLPSCTCPACSLVWYPGRAWWRPSEERWSARYPDFRPAGFGKTALLADWIRQEGRPAVWGSLDAGDNDPARFWRHAAAALDRVHPGTGERIAPLLGIPAPYSFEALVTALVNELASQPGEDEALLVLDDYHLIGSRSVHTSLEFLLEHLPTACIWC